MQKKITLMLFIALAVSGISLAQNYVTLYKDCNYGGGSEMFKAGRYTLKQTRIGAAQLSSIKVPNGMRVVLYTSDVPGGGSSKMIYTNDVSCLSRDWNDKTFSIIVDNIGNATQLPENPPVNNSLVTLYEDCNYRGRSNSLSAGYHDVNRLGIKNDGLSSIRIPSGWTITIYENANYSGKSTSYSGDVSCLSRDWNDKVSSVLITRSNNNNNNNNNVNTSLVTLYEDCYYGGRASSLSAGYHDVNGLGLSNDNLSSIRIPSGWSITVYEDAKYSGRSATYSGDVSCLSRDWNDKVSSVLITRNKNNNNNNNNNYYPESSNDYVTLYEDENFGGKSITLRSGSINYLPNVGFPDNALSSLQLPAGWKVVLYDQPNFKGSSYNVLRTKNKFNFSGWADKASSMIIYTTGGSY